MDKWDCANPRGRLASLDVEHVAHIGFGRGSDMKLNHNQWIVLGVVLLVGAGLYFVIAQRNEAGLPSIIVGDPNSLANGKAPSSVITYKTVQCEATGFSFKYQTGPGQNWEFLEIQQSGQDIPLIVLDNLNAYAKNWMLLAPEAKCPADPTYNHPRIDVSISNFNRRNKGQTAPHAVQTVSVFLADENSYLEQTHLIAYPADGGAVFLRNDWK